MSEHESPLSVTRAPSSGLSRLQVLKAAAASTVGAIALALPASGLSAPAPQRSRVPVTPPGTLTHGVSSVVVSPDNKYLYAVANASNSLTVFSIAR